MRFLSRSEWGADSRHPRRGHIIGPLKRTEVVIHHTVIIDVDTTPNEWASVRDVKKQMRRLQTIRPDLGLDVPYSFVAFRMENDNLILGEGRGLRRTGAHTVGHNRSALGIAFHGNFERQTSVGKLRRQLGELGSWLQDLRVNHGFTNLGSTRPDNRDVFGHRDFASTACPGKRLFAQLDAVRFLEEDTDSMMDKATWKKVQSGLQALDPPLYAGRRIDGKPGRGTNTAVQAFERRVGFTANGVMGTPNDPSAPIWPATRELLFAIAFSD